MSKALLSIVNDQLFEEIVTSSYSFQEILGKIGYKNTSNNATIEKVKERCNSLNISFAHVSNNKQCSICREIKPITEFYFMKGKSLSCCKECWKQKEKEKYQNRVEQFNNYKKSLSCKKCGESRYYLLDFHHKNPQEKEFSISDHSRASFETVKKEIEKCDILCANCHREWHYLSKENNLLTYEEWLSGEMGELV